MRSTIAAVTAILPVMQVLCSVEDPGRLPTPPMGFNDWARFQCAINESLFTSTADAMVAKGLLKAGYDRINIDDCWPIHERAANGSLQWNETMFPNGLPWLANYVKQRGFHLGIYSDAGNLTCGGYPGSLGHEQIDADTFTAWGIDYLKLDGCNVYARPDQTLEQRYRQLYHRWHEILKGPETPLIFSESAPAYFAGEPDLTDWFTVMDWVPHYGELARHSYDIQEYEYTKRPWHSVMTNYGEETRLAREQRAGYYNDPDFLIADEPYLTLEEKRSQFALWATLSAPLIISADIPNLPDDAVEYLTNEDLIAVDQDPLALQATLVSRDGTWDVLTKSLADGDRVVTILNNGSQAGEMEVSLERIGWVGHWGGDGKLAVKDLWTGMTSTVNAGNKGAAIKASVPSHGTAVFRISSGAPASYHHHMQGLAWAPTGLIFDAASLNCLTFSHGGLSFATCDGSEGQVWRVGKQGGYMSPLADLHSCVIAGEDGTSVVVSGHCSRSSEPWHYGPSGNIRLKGSKKCLTEGMGGRVSVEACGFLKDDQVFEMPSGWQL